MGDVNAIIFMCSPLSHPDNTATKVWGVEFVQMSFRFECREELEPLQWASDAHTKDLHLHNPFSGFKEKRTFVHRQHLRDTLLL